MRDRLPAPALTALALALAALALVALPSTASDANPAVGRWKTIDDATGKVKSIVEVTEAADGTLQGKVVEVLHSDRGPDPVCDRCDGANRNKPIKGMTILWGLKRKGDRWTDGTVLDPANGKTYRSKVELLDAGRKLGMSGCITIICRQQVWLRE